MHAPVSVARSRIRPGWVSAANASASARISLPSASVFMTSTVLPLRIVRTSPSFMALPPVMFSVRAM